eukprot:13037343-Alexandrium_andersonii.AAC.1
MAKIKDDVVTPQRREGPVLHAGPDTHNTWDPNAWGRKVIAALEQALHVSSYARSRTSPGDPPSGSGTQAPPRDKGAGQGARVGPQATYTGAQDGRAPVWRRAED